MSKVKIIDKNCEKSIKGEREILSKLHHSFIVNMYCAFQDFENLYLVMDLLTGGDLRYHYCRIRRFTEEETKFFIGCVLLGLEYIHNNNILHRDIKPENLVSDENGYIRITDFGIAKTNKLDNSAETSGTPGYMAPEVILSKNYTFTVDFFAIGAIGYEFMLGKRPYNGDNRKQIRHLILKSQVQIDKDKVDWSEESVDFINKCLKRIESRRLGYLHGIKELKEHKWFENFNWDELFNKKLIAPFIPKKEGNYDKSYCEVDENCGEETKIRYASYTERKNFDKLFFGYTYVNLDLVNYFINENTSTKRQKNSQNKNDNVNKKERIGKNNMIIKEFLNKSKNLLKKHKNSNNNNIIINNYNNINFNVNSLIINKNFLGNNQKKSIDKSEKLIKKENISQLPEKELEANINKKLIGRNKSNIKRKDFINEDLNNISDKNINKKKGLLKSPSIFSLMCSPSNGKKLKLEKNSSLSRLKGEANLFSYNNNQNMNETNLSNLLSSNSILNLNKVLKVGYLKSFRNNKDKRHLKSSSIEQAFSFNNINISKYPKNKRSNKNNIINYGDNSNKLSYNSKSKNAGFLTGRHSQIILNRNNSSIKLKFKNKTIDNTFSINSTFMSPVNKNIVNNISKIINFHSNTNRTLKANDKRNNNYIQLRQNKKNILKNKLLFYFPNWKKIDNNKKINYFNIEDMKNNEKFLVRNMKFKMMKNKIENDKDKIKNRKDSLQKERSMSNLLSNKEVKFKRKINHFININKLSFKNDKRTNSIVINNSKREKLIKNLRDEI